MDRRRFLIGLTGTGVGVLLSPALAIAQTVADPVLRALTKQGYGDITIKRTWLGRLRITAERGGRQREIILNKRTGEVLRDVVYLEGRSTSGFEDNENDGDTGNSASHNNTRGGESAAGKTSGSSSDDHDSSSDDRDSSSDDRDTSSDDRDTSSDDRDSGGDDHDNHDGGSDDDDDD
jgi:hypothetical protein